jgi:hypothetical protein
MEWNKYPECLPDKEGRYWVAYEVERDGKRILKINYLDWLEHSRVYKGNKFGWKSKLYAKRSTVRYWMPFLIPEPPKE